MMIDKIAGNKKICVDTFIQFKTKTNFLHGVMHIILFGVSQSIEINYLLQLNKARA